MQPPIRPETTWLKRSEDKKLEELLHTSDKEYALYKSIIDTRIKDGKEPPFRIGKKELKDLVGDEDAKYVNHSVLVIPDEDGGYKIGLVARSRMYKTSEGEEVKEGILGYGSFGVAKVIRWEDGSIDAVKIEGAKPEERDKEDPDMEEEIMLDLGVSRATFVENKTEYKEWIGSRKIGAKKYIVQKLHAGVEMFDYFGKTENEAKAWQKKRMG